MKVYYVRMSGMTPIRITDERFTAIRKQLIEDRGQKYCISAVVKRDLGWSPRYNYISDHSDYGYVYIDFWDDSSKTMFLLEFGTDGIVEKNSLVRRQALEKIENRRKYNAILEGDNNEPS
jgi:hypothetical protein